MLQFIYFIKFYKIIKYFYKYINYYCNFFLSIQIFYKELFFNIGYIENNKYTYTYDLKKIFNKNYNMVFKFSNTVFNNFVNNYYIIDFYSKNSKTMSFSSLKKYRVFKL